MNILNLENHHLSLYDTWNGDSKSILIESIEIHENMVEFAGPLDDGTPKRNCVTISLPLADLKELLACNRVEHYYHIDGCSLCRTFTLR